MRGLRTLIIVAILLVVAGLVYFLVRPQLLSPAAKLPFDLTRLIPPQWDVIPGATECDFNRDTSNTEFLVLYHYDKSAGQPNGMIGGLILGPEVNRVPQQPSVQAPYRPALLVPYRLLPDIYSGKGQGYLGDDDVQTRTYPALSRTPCSAQEIAFLGYTSGRVTRLSLFHWDPANNRYDGSHLTANAHLDAGPNIDLLPITQVTTYDRLSDRSNLCVAKGYTRPAGAGDLAPSTLTFTENPDAYTIDYCFGAPLDPVYPEGVVVNVLRNATTTGLPTIPGTTGFFTDTALAKLPENLRTALGSATHPAYRIVALSNPGYLGDYPAEGAGPAAGTATAAESWWWGAEQANVRTTVIVDGKPQDLLWRLRTVANLNVLADQHWRIVSVTVP